MHKNSYGVNLIPILVIKLDTSEEENPKINLQIIITVIIHIPKIK